MGMYTKRVAVLAILSLLAYHNGILLSEEPEGEAEIEAFDEIVFDSYLWYDRPADAYGLASPLQAWKSENPKRTHKPNPDQAWERYALPLGNGFLGAMVYGGVGQERVQFNEHSLWSGGPGSEGWKQSAQHARCAQASA